MCHQGGRKKPGASSRRLGPRLGPCQGALGTGTGGPAGWKAPCTACSCWELLRARPEHTPVCGALRLVSATRRISPTGNPGICVLPEVTPPRPCADGGPGGRLWALSLRSRHQGRVQTGVRGAAVGSASFCPGQWRRVNKFHVGPQRTLF